MKWFLADLVTEVRVESAERSRVEFELHLVRADSAAEAYEKALRLGARKATQYLRGDGLAVEHVFRGLNDLVAFEGAFRDGARLLERAQSEMAEEEIRQVVTPRDDLRALRAETPDDAGRETIQ